MSKNNQAIKSGLCTEIAFTLIVKVLLLSLLWYFFFQNPNAKHLTDQDVAAQFFSTQPSAMPSK